MSAPIYHHSGGTLYVGKTRITRQMALDLFEIAGAEFTAAKDAGDRDESMRALILASEIAAALAHHKQWHACGMPEYQRSA